MSKAIRTRAKSVIRDFKGENPDDEASAEAEQVETHVDPVVPEAPKEPVVAEVSRCLVYCRLRPNNKRDYEDGATQLVTVSGKRVILKDEKNYDFDGTFGQDCKQTDLFEQVAVPCLSHAFKGFCSALMCYGQTGTGKSFTMCCTKPGLEGIIPRSAEFIFNKINSDPGTSYTVSGQFVQIYRDQLGDLMSEDGKEKVDIRFQADEGVSLPGASTHTLMSAEHFMDFYREGDARRVVTATAMNPESSRGHTALIVWIKSQKKDDDCSPETRGKITFIDLAGYERFSKTGISNANTIMKDEAKTINASLLSLGHVVTALSNGDKHIPWRNAKLTRILQDSIGGRSRTSIILTVGPSSDHLHETTNSLQFGNRAMAVKVEAKVSVSVDYEKLAAKLQALLNEKDERINMLEVQVASNSAEREEMMERHRRDEELLRKRHEEELEELRTAGASADKLMKLNEQYEIEVENLKEQQQEEVEYAEEAHNKEIIALAEEQQREESLKHTEMVMAQERIIADFEKKLASAREGTNDDLIKAIQELSQKDAVLAARSSEIAKLHDHISNLTQQLRENDVEPAAPVLVAPTFLDISQVEELQSRFQEELDSKQVQLLDFRNQIDKINATCNERADRINNLVEEVESLNSQLKEAGVSMQEKQRELSVTRVSMVDKIELETLRITMQSDIDAAEKRIESLEEKLEEKSQQVKDLTSKRPRGNSLLNSSFGGTTRGLNNTSMLGTTVLEGTLRERPGQQDSAVKGKYAQLLEENNELRSRVGVLEEQLKSAGIEVVREPTPIRDECDSYAIEKLRETELEAVQKLAQRREESRANEAAKCAKIQAQFDPSCSVTEYAAVASLPFEEFTKVLAASRATSLALIRRLTKSEKFSEEELDSILEEKDDELLLKDETLLSRSAHIRLLQKQLSLLEDQVETLGAVPECRLPDDVRQEMVENDATADELHDNHSRLQQELEEHQAEQDKMKSVLASLTQDRAREAQVFASYKQSLETKLKETEERAKALEEKEMRIQKVMGEIVSEQSAKEEKAAKLEDDLKEVTRQMMEQQAKLAEEQQRSMFDRFKSRFKK